MLLGRFVLPQESSDEEEDKRSPWGMCATTAGFGCGMFSIRATLGLDILLASEHTILFKTLVAVFSSASAADTLKVSEPSM